MRSESEMLELIVGTAREDERIRAVIMNGSRVNPNVEPDIFRDFDIVYVVTDVESFTRDHSWVRRFGEMMILQMPDLMDDPPPAPGEHFAYLMQFMDGNRIDLSLVPRDRLHLLEKDSLSLLLLDKDGLIGSFPPPDESSYLPQPPTRKQFDDCCNEFWWVSPYAAKGLWRRQIVYAKTMLDGFIREQLNKMITWYIGVRTGFTQTPGGYGKHFQKYLEPELWDLLLKTYSDAEYDHMWEALEAMGCLFRKLALPVAEHFGYPYPQGDDDRVSAHLRHVRSLPRDAKAIH